MSSADYIPALKISDSGERYPIIKRPYFNKKTIFSCIILISVYMLARSFPPLHIAVTLLAIALTIIKIVRDNILPLIYDTHIKSRHRGQALKNIETTNAELELPDKTILRGVFRKAFKNNDDKKLIIYFHGNGGIAGSGVSISITNNFQNHDVLEMNYQGTLNSEGACPTHQVLTDDGIKIVQAAINSNYKPENITLFGISLGGSLVTKIQQTFNAKYPNQPMTLITYHTFYSLRRFASWRFPRFLQSPITLFTTIILKTIGWDYNFTIDEWNKLKGNLYAMGGGEDDWIIPEAFSLASLLKSAQQNGQGAQGDVEIKLKGHNEINLQGLPIVD